MNSFVLDLMSKMTIDEKIGQMYQTYYDGSNLTGADYGNSNFQKLLREGKIGSILGLNDTKVYRELQRIATEETRLGIPIMNCLDIIHGCKTILPNNIAMSCSWNPELIKESNVMVASETINSGGDLTFAPMLDLARDPRWGRCTEGNGEDPYLASALAKAETEGFKKGGLACCAKHYVGYGACFGGRDYDGVDMSISTLFNYYLPPFKSSVDSKVDMVMTSFNTLNGIPSTANSYLVDHILRKKYKFNGVVISDWGSVLEEIEHRVAKDEKECAEKSIKAGVDIEMATSTYINHAKELVLSGALSEEKINDACYRILDLKYRMGLFKDPYIHIKEEESKYLLTDSNKKQALKMAYEAICLLENDGVLPLKKRSKVCYVGPFVNEKKVAGAWPGRVNYDDCVTIKEALDKDKYKYSYAIGSNMLDTNQDLIQEAIKASSDCDEVVITIGEEDWMSGEGHSRAHLDCLVPHDLLVDEMIKLNKKIILVIFSGRPLVLTKYKKLFEEKKIHAIFYAWFLGTMSGKAIVDTLYGLNNPSGKITMTFPYDLGQVPIYYNHYPSGRPNIKLGNNDYRVHYIDVPFNPLYPFGYGLSYSKFKYGEIILSKDEINIKENIEVKIKVKNESNRVGKEIVELYIQSPPGILSRPVKELKGFKKINLKPFEEKEVVFTLKPKDLMYYMDEKLVPYFGKYKVYVGASSMTKDFKEFTLK